MKNFEGKNALVVGGSGGIGFEISRMLLKNGANLIIHGRNLQKLEKTRQNLKSEFENKMEIKIVPFDFDSEPFENLQNSELIKEIQKIDILCVCYGHFLQKSLDKMSFSEWQKISLLDYALPGICVSAALSEMKKKQFGRILLFGGTGTNFRSEFLTNAAYAGAKTGLGVLVQSVACGFSSDGITCNAILPGFTETEYQSEKILEEGKNKMPEKKLIERYRGICIQ